MIHLLLGATATGKTAVASAYARRTGALALSADSMLVYRGMDIGTAKPTPEEYEGVDWRGIDLVAPDEPFNTGLWWHAAEAALAEAREDGRDVIVAGGTGLYAAALLRGGLDAPAAVNTARRARLQKLWDTEGAAPLLAHAEELRPGSTDRIDKANPHRVIRLVEILEDGGEPAGDGAGAMRTLRIPDGMRVTVLTFPRPALAERIARRARAMFENGLVDEVRGLREHYPTFANSTAGAGIGYAEAAAVLDGTMTLEQAIERTTIRTRQLAKRQETWWRNQLPADGTHWLPGPATAADIAPIVNTLLDTAR